jgi:hypothetical protein
MLEITRIMKVTIKEMTSSAVMGAKASNAMRLLRPIVQFGAIKITQRLAHPFLTVKYTPNAVFCVGLTAIPFQIPGGTAMIKRRLKA